jgi:hypothetical protein
MGVINQNEGLTIKPPPPELQDAEREIERLRARVQSLASQLADELVAADVGRLAGTWHPNWRMNSWRTSGYAASPSTKQPLRTPA